MAADAVAVGAQTFWAQLGLSNDEAAGIAHRAGLAVVMDRCLKIEHARFAGGLHLAGLRHRGDQLQTAVPSRPLPLMAPGVSADVGASHRGSRPDGRSVRGRRRRRRR